jgi:hypothetical protein
VVRQGGVYGLRINRLAVEGVDRGGVIDFAADALFREFGSVLDIQPDPAVQVQAFSPRAGEPAWLRPTLRPTPEPGAASQDVTWRVAPHRADATGLIRWTDRETPPVLEFDVPEVRLFGARVPRVRVLEVRGPEVAGWSQVGGRVAVWLRKADRPGAIEWVGVAAPVSRGRPVPEPLGFEPVVPRLVGAKTASTTLRVIPADGWAVRVERDRGWAALPSDDRREWAFRSDGSVVPPRLLLYSPRGGPARGFGMVELTGDTATYRATVEVPLRAGRPHHLVLRAAGLPPGATVELDTPPATVAIDCVNTATHREWDLDVPASTVGPFRASVVVRFPVGSIRLPAVDLRVGGSDPDAGEVNWVGLVGGGRPVRLVDTVPISPAGMDEVRRRWPGEAERLRRAGGSAWVVAPGAIPTLTIGSNPGDPSVPARTAELTPAPGLPQPAPAADAPSSPPDREPVLAAAGWCLAVVGLIVLFGRFPHATWPEQLGMTAGLLGFVLGGAWWVGLPVAVAARLAWLVRTVSFRTSPGSSTTPSA